MNKLATRTKKYVSDHRVAIAVSTTFVLTTTLALVIAARNATMLNDFLKEHDLFDEYYFTDEI